MIAKAVAHGDAVRGGRCELPDERFERRLDQVREGRLADPAQRQRGHRDPKLAGRDVGVEVADHLLRRLGGAVPLSGELFEARAADGDDRELGGHEEAVRQHQHDHGHQAER